MSEPCPCPVSGFTHIMLLFNMITNIGIAYHSHTNGSLSLRFLLLLVFIVMMLLLTLFSRSVFAVLCVIRLVDRNASQFA